MTTVVNCEFCKSLKSFFCSPLTLALSPRWGEREKEEGTFGKRYKYSRLPGALDGGKKGAVSSAPPAPRPAAGKWKTPDPHGVDVMM